MDTNRLDRGQMLGADRRCSRRVALRVGVAGLVAATGLAAGRRATQAQAATPAASPSADNGDFSGLVDSRGRNLYLEAHGTGAPTVVLIAGYRSSARYW